MLNQSYDQIIERIVSESDSTKEDVESKINEKLNQLSGLISKEGAAHIIANEMGVQLTSRSEGNDSSQQSKIKDLAGGMRNLELTGKVMVVFDIREFQKEDRSGKVGAFIFADETAQTKIVCWGEKADAMKDLSKGDVVRLTGGMAKENNGNIEVHANENTQIEKNPEGVQVDVEVQQNERRKISELKENESNIEILGHIVQVFDPKFYEICPECGKRIRGEEGEYNCPAHGKVEPDYGYLLNCVLDDGSENIRTVCFRKQVEQMLGKSREEVLNFRENPETFTPIKNELLGEMVKLRGKVSSNAMFDRLEFVAFAVDTNPDPEEELQQVNKQE